MKLIPLTSAVVLLLSITVNAQLIINEIMYNPSADQGPDSSLEWIEIYNNYTFPVNMSSWKLDNSFLGEHLLSPSDYMVIARDSEAFVEFYSPQYSVLDGSFSLVNGGDFINLSNSTDEVIAIYQPTGANGNGKTLEWTGTVFVESLGNGTPGTQNSVVGTSRDIQSLIITEFLPNPAGNDDALSPNGEWVELYNPTQNPIDARGLVLYDSNDDHELYISHTTTANPIIPAYGYAVVYRNADTDFALNNNGFDEVRLFTDTSRETMLDTVSYSGSNEGMSWSNIGGTWLRTIPTPGKQNIGQGDCDWEIKVNPTTSIFTAGTDVTWQVTLQKHYGSGATATVSGSIEDVFGTILKSYKPWTNETIETTRTKSYSPNLNREVYVIRFKIDHLDCKDDNLEDNVDEELITINPNYKSGDSFLEIKEIYDLGSNDKAEWGDTLRTKIAIYKGNSTRSSVKLWLENRDEVRISKISRVNLDEKFTNLTTTIPIEINRNCNNEFIDGTYYLIIEGLGKRFDTPIKVQGFDAKACSEESSETNSVFSFSIHEFPASVPTGSQFNTQVKIIGDSKQHQLTLWSYVFRGSKSYTGDRESNKKVITIKENEQKIVSLPSLLNEDTQPGDYKLKVNLKKDNQKTTNELTERMLVTIPSGRIDDLFVDEFASNNATTITVKTDGVPGTTVGLVSFFGEQLKPTTGTDVKFPVELLEMDNIFFAKLIDEDDNLMDVSQLSVRFEEGKVKEVTQRVELSKESENFLRERLKTLRERKNAPGIVIYESSSRKARELAPWVFISALSLLSIILIFKKI
jgi:hypothetical protein